MSTSHLSGKPSAFDRLVDHLLDVDGDMYGQDERERTRWYERIAVAASVQWMVVPWVMAVLVWMVGADAARALSYVGIAFLLPLIFATVYVEHRKVDTAVRHWTAKRIVWTTVTMLPILIFIVGYMHATGASQETVAGTAIGGVFGAAAAFGIMVLKARRTRNAPDDDE